MWFRRRPRKGLALIVILKELHLAAIGRVKRLVAKVGCVTGIVSGGPVPVARTKVRQKLERDFMTTLTRWNPFKEMEEMQRRLGSVFELAPLRKLAATGEEERLTVAEWLPLVDIIEDDKEYLISAELPEVLKGDVKVTVENGILHLAGERKFEKEEQGKKYHRIERSYGSFVRSFTLPDDADAEKVHADFKDGVLKVHVAKSEKACPKQIKIDVA